MKTLLSFNAKHNRTLRVVGIYADDAAALTAFRELAVRRISQNRGIPEQEVADMIKSGHCLGDGFSYYEEDCHVNIVTPERCYDYVFLSDIQDIFGVKTKKELQKALNILLNIFARLVRAGIPEDDIDKEELLKEVKKEMGSAA